ncbi:MAG: hypothetical protein HYY84_03620 [Deltaproteobacteria bacterium]|nr:hypothetical protein [Deltaproteobacteria bacterium]
MRALAISLAIFIGFWIVAGGLAAVVNELILARRSVFAVYLLLGVVFGSLPAFLTFLAYLRSIRQRMGRPRLM